jgi:Ca-activated chloride channel homolog
MDRDAMRKLLAVFLLAALSIGLTAALRAQTRPRRVEKPADVPQSTSPSPNTPRRPPVLTGNIGTGQQSKQETPVQTNDGPEEVAEGDVVRVETTLVTIPVSVMDRDGRYIPDLRKEDFRIFEDGIEHEVAYFASAEKPFTVALLLDNSPSTKFRLEEIQDAAIAFVDQLRPDDRVMVVSFNEQVDVLCEVTNDRNALRRAIRHTHTDSGTSLYDAVDLVINQRFNRIEGRKAIVLFTDGVDTTSKRGSYESNVFDAEELDALIYPVQYDTFKENVAAHPKKRKPGILDVLVGVLTGEDITGGTSSGGGAHSGTTRREYDRAERYLGDLALRTGARRYRTETTDNLAQSFRLIAEELRRQYSLGYYPRTAAQTGQRRQIKVRVNQPDLIVRSRDSYISTSQSAHFFSGHNFDATSVERFDLRVKRAQRSP